ncbi:MAG TPA: zinc-binding dehydrogenase, partial [Spirillospora sp.]
GALGRDMPADGVAEYVHDPHDPVPTVGGAILMAGSPDGGLAYQPGSRDQRVLDGPVGGPQLAAAWNLLAPGGLVQNIGWASDEPARFAPHELLFIGPSKTMSTVGDTRDVGPDLATLLRFTAAGRLSPEAGWRGPWENFAEAARALLDRRIAGKAVLDVTAEPAG